MPPSEPPSSTTASHPATCRGDVGRGTAGHVHAALAAFIKEGDLARHIRGCEARTSVGTTC
jgi:hypothetical protein